MSNNYDNIPDELKPLKQWVMWRLEEVENKQGKRKPTKVPYKTMMACAATTRKDEWKTFDEAVDMVEGCKDLPKWSRGYKLDDVGFNGVGFVFTDEDEYVGIDWDHIRDADTGEIEAQYVDEMTALDTYVEVSQSGDGAHAICKGIMPGDKHRKANTPYEMYESKRFFVMTGNHQEGTPTEIRESPKEAIKAIYDKIDPPKEDKKTKTVIQPTTQRIEDKNIIELCQAASNADKFNSLYNGNIGEYGGDQSAADMALCTLLAFYTQDQAQIERIFEGSGLIREKWTSRKDYRDRTIQNAISGLTETYTPKAQKNTSDEVTEGIKAEYAFDGKLWSIQLLADNKRVGSMIANKKPFSMNVDVRNKGLKKILKYASNKAGEEIDKDEVDNIVFDILDIGAKNENDVKNEFFKKVELQKQLKDEKDGLFNTDQSGNCSLNYIAVAEKLSNKHSVIGYRGSIYVYSDGIYIEGSELIKTEIANLSKCVGCNGGIRVPTLEIIQYLTYDNPAQEYPFNNYSDMIPVANGIVKIDFAKGEFKLIPHSSKYKFNYKFDIDYRKPIAHVGATKIDVIDEVLHDYVSDHDVDILYQIPAQAILQALGSAPFKKAYLLQGDPHAAKSGYIELLLRLFGKETHSHVPLQAIGNDRFALADLEGKIFNTYDDLSNVPIKDGGVFKTLTGGHEHHIQRKGVQGHNATITAVHVYTCNTPPEFDKFVQHDTAFWERWEYVYFGNTFAVDPFFYDDTFTKENLEMCFYHILEYVVNVKNNGLKVKSTASEVREKWSASADPLYQYIDTNLEHSDNVMYVDKDKLLESYKRWCAANDIDGQKITTTKKALTRAIDKYGVISKRVRNANGMRIQCYEMPYKWAQDSRHEVEKVKVNSEQDKLF